MSHPINEQLAEEFFSQVDYLILCPYCGEPNQLDPPLGCCGEIHSDWHYQFIEGHPREGEFFHYFDLQDEFQKWLDERGEPDLKLINETTTVVEEDS